MKGVEEALQQAKGAMKQLDDAADELFMQVRLGTGQMSMLGRLYLNSCGLGCMLVRVCEGSCGFEWVRVHAGQGLCSCVLGSIVRLHASHSPCGSRIRGL